MEEKILKNNIDYLMRSLPFFGFIGLLMVFVAVITEDNLKIVYIHSFFSASAFLLFLGIVIEKKIRLKESFFVYQVIVHLSIFTFIFWGSNMIGYRANSIVAIFDYIAVALLTGFFINIKWSYFTIHVAINLGYLILFTPLRYMQLESSYLLEISLVIFGIVSIFLAYLSYNKTLQTLKMEEALTNQQNMLEKRIKEQSVVYAEREIIYANDVIKVLVSILGHHDDNSKGHSENVAYLSENIAKILGYDIEFQRKVYWAAMVHDVGKIKVDRALLNKEGYLNNIEMDAVRKHPTYSYEMIKEIENLKDLAKDIFHHHEHYDGKGYPLGLKGDQIPRISQILAVADAWDAMTNQRNYREPMTEEEALLEIEKGRGKQFAPDVVDAFASFVKYDIINTR